MLLEQHLIQLFGNLPYLPQTEIIKHLDTFNLHRLSVISENWDQAIIDLMKIVVVEKRRTYHLISQLFIKLVTKEQSAELILFASNCDETWEKLSIDFAVSQSSSFVLRSKRSITICSRSFTALQRSLLDTVNRLQTVFPSEFYRVNLNFDHGFSRLFLNALNIRKISWMTLEAEEARVNGEKLEGLLKRIKISAELELRVNTVRRWKGGAYLLNNSVHLEDSRWMTSYWSICNFNSFSGHFKKCRLTADDLNEFFWQWNIGRKDNVRRLEFHLKEPIRLEDVVSGLCAKPWDPEVRPEKTCWESMNKLQIIDLRKGLDVTKGLSDDLATIHLSEDGKLLRFHQWHRDRLGLKELKKELIDVVHKYDRYLSYANIEVEEEEFYEKKIRREMESIRLLKKELEKDNPYCFSDNLSVIRERISLFHISRRIEPDVL